MQFEKLSTENRDEYLDFLIEAHRDQFNRQRFKERESVNIFLQWEYIDNPGAAKDCPFIWLARMDGKIAGHFCVMPAALKINDKAYKGGWCQDLIVSRQYRKMGIGRSLVSHVIKEAAKYLDLLLVAGTNDASYLICKNAGFIDTGNIPLYVRVNRLKLGNFSIKLFSRAKSTDIYIKEITSFDDSFDKLWLTASPAFGFIIRRDSAYLNWRFVSQPYPGYKIFKAFRKDTDDTAGYIVLREGESRGLRTGVITDIFASLKDPDIITSLIDFAISHFSKRDDIALIRCDVLNKDIGKALKKHGFASIYSNARFMAIDTKNELGAAFFTRRDNWFLDYADGDLDISGQRRT